MIIGEGMYRQCIGCQIVYGCHHPDGNTYDCNDCNNVCPDTEDTSHGICDTCFEIIQIGRLLKKEAANARKQIQIS